MSNCIILMSDEHNPLYTSVFGHPFVQTPNLERLAREGTVYRNAYCPSPLCTPSRSAFVSGRRVHEIQAYSNCHVDLPHHFPTYGKVLKEQGVHAVHIGKTHVYAQPDQLEFSEMHMAKKGKLPGDINFRRKPLAVRTNAAERAFGFGIKEDAFERDLRVMDTALQWIEQTAPGLEQPWSLTIHLINPHFPQWNTEELWKLYPQGEDLPRYGREQESANHPYARDLRDHFETDLFTEAQIRGLRRGYLGNVTFIDTQIGRILDSLTESDQAGNTNFVYTSDHGEMLGKFGQWWKCSLYEDSVKIPVFASGPDFQAGAVVDTPVDLHDVQAAVFHATGASRPEEWAGQPLQEIPSADVNRIVFSEYHGHGTRSGAYMIRKGDWKLIYYMEAPHQLFNLKTDPDELSNVYRNFPDKANELEAELRRICNPEQENQRAHQFQQVQIEWLESNGFVVP